MSDRGAIRATSVQSRSMAELALSDFGARFPLHSTSINRAVPLRRAAMAKTKEIVP
ncbi:hypothetical protein [Rhodanobacter sp. C01]|uniref:hypothetical protein n=1 Tax=Rhodanobacter sp. C01 TaxID=1945856 RepID=UPI00143A8AC6|nr:hypothetical protein [Rhodanobacter sp. C01]